jgi:hypothetical protein
MTATALARNYPSAPAAELTPQEAWDLAYANAHCDNQILQWLAEAHANAWRNQDLYTQIKCMYEASKIEGKAWPPVRKRRSYDDDYQKDYDEEMQGSMR